MSIAFWEEAISWAGSPGRRGATWAGHLAGGLDHLPDGEPHPVAQVEHIALPAGQQGIQRQNMGLGQVAHMDVIPHAGAVLGGIVVPKDHNLLPPPRRHLEDQGDQVGFRIVRLADGPGRVGAAGVKIPQRHIPQAVGPGRPSDHLLHGPLGLPVAVGGRKGVPLQDGHPLRFPIDRRRGGKQQLVHTVGGHLLQEGKGPAQVVVVVLKGMIHRLPHLGAGGEVDHPLHLFLVEDPGKGRPVPDIRLVKPGLWVDRLPKTGLQIVHHRHLPAGLDQLVHGVGANVPGSPQH